MILVPDEEEKLKENNQRRRHAEKVVDSAMNIAGEMVNRSGLTQQRGQAGGDITAGLTPREDMPAGSEGDILSFDPERPFSSATYPTVSGGGTTVPTYSVKDVFSARMEPTAAPVRDAAAYDRVQKQQKFNAISKGLQAVFGGLVAASGEVAPAPYESGMTQALMQNLQGLDDKYFREMAEWRDQELRKEMFNANQAAQADQARLQKMREDAQALRDQGRYEDAKKLQAEADKYQRGVAERELQLKEKGLGLDAQRQQSYSRQNQIQTIGAYDDAILREQQNLKILQGQKEDAFGDQEAEKSIQAQIDEQQQRINTMGRERDQLIKQLSGREGFNIPSSSASGGDAAPANMIDTIKAGLDAGEMTYDDAVESIVQQAESMGYDPNAARDRAKKMLGAPKAEGGKTSSASTKSTDERAKERVLATKSQDLESEAIKAAKLYKIPQSEIAKLKVGDPDFVARLDSLIRKYGEVPERPYVDGQLVYHPDLFGDFLKKQHQDLLKTMNQ